MAHSGQPTPTTEQEAVNIMLASIGERPVNNIHESQRGDVLRAVRALNQASVEIQSRGWWFNEEHQTLTVNLDGEYVVPAGVIRVVPDYAADKGKFVLRGTRLYNTVDNTYAGHTADLKVSWVRLLPFDDMPETARCFVAFRAGVKFQKTSFGSTTLFQFTKEDEQEALGLLHQEELDQDGSNLFQSPFLNDLIYRR